MWFSFKGVRKKKTCPRAGLSYVENEIIS